MCCKLVVSSHVGSNRYGCYRRVVLSNDGKYVQFKYPNGISYRVLSPFIYSWYSKTPILFRGNRWIVLSESVPLVRERHGEERVVSMKKLWGIYNRRAQWVRLYFHTGVAIDVEYDHLLAHCEPAFVDFGWAGNTLTEYQDAKGRSPVTVSVAMSEVVGRHGWTFSHIVLGAEKQTLRFGFDSGDEYYLSGKAVDSALCILSCSTGITWRALRSSAGGFQIPLIDIAVRRRLDRKSVIHELLHMFDYRFAGDRAHSIGSRYSAQEARSDA